MSSALPRLWTLAWLTVAVMLLTVLVAGALTPGYRHAAMFISELGARGAPLEAAVRWGGFLPAGLLLTAFTVTAWRSLPRSRAATLGWIGLGTYALGYLIAVPFPCDPGCRPVQPSLAQLIHNTVGLAGYVLAPVSLVALARAARTWPGARALVPLGHAGAAAAALGLLTLDPASPWVGASQRLIEGAVLAWVLACGALHRPGRPTGPSE